MPIFCSVEGCHRNAKVRGMCKPHYDTWRRCGDPTKYKSYSKTELYLLHKREYSSYLSMKTRCYNSNHQQFKDYGGRGIKVCDRWIGRCIGFKNFIDDMGPRPQGYSLDRIDVNGDYCPENCRWTDRKTQQNNMRNSVRISYGGETHSCEEWGKILGMPTSSIRYRLRRYGEKDALRHPFHKR